MAKQFNTIDEYLADSKYDAIYKKLSKYIGENQRNLVFKKYESYDYTSVRLDDFSITSVCCERNSEDIISFNIQVQADLILKLNKEYDYEETTEFMYFSLNAVGKLSDKLESFRIIEVDEYKKKKFDKNKTLSKGLIPYIYNEDLDDYASKFLKEFCPEALVTPMSLPIDKILNRMGLVKRNAPMADNVFGKIYFNNETVLVYDDNNDAFECDLNPGTILINPNCFFMRNIGSSNNTIIHECLHWYLHKNFFDLLKIISPNGKHIECEIDTSYDNDCDFSDELKWIEWQASSIAPKVLIPREMGIKKFNECLEKVGMFKDGIFPNNVKFDNAVNLFAEFFNVTKISAKIRLLELGFVHALGVYNFCDGRVMDSFYFKDGELQPGQTYFIDSVGAAIEQLRNKTFRERVLNEEIIYVNHTFVLNNEKYIGTYKNGKKYLTQYALNHMDECCIIFDTNVNMASKPTYFSLCYLCRTIDISNTLEKKYSRNNKVELDAQSIDALKNKHAEEEKIFRELPSHPGRTIKYHLERKNMTHQQLADRSKISKRTCDYYMSDYDVSNPDIFDVVAICIGMNLSANFSRDLLKKFGFDIDGKHDINYDSLRFIIENCHQYTIDSCNDVLKELGCKRKIPSGSQPKKTK